MARGGWTQSLIDGEKARLRDELQTLGLRGGRAVVKRALERIGDLEDSLDQSRPRLTAFLSCVQALLHHSRRPCLTPGQVESLMERANAILLLQGVKPRKSHLSFLYGELHQAASLIFRRDGRLFRASWEQLLSGYMAAVVPLGADGFTAFASAGRSLRLGMAALAMQQFESAIQQNLRPRQALLAYLGKLRCLRLAGDFTAAKTFATTSSAVVGDLAKHATAEDVKSIKREWVWEEHCIACCEKNDFRPLLAKTKRGGGHYQASYVLEVFFWFHAQGKALPKNLTKISSLATYKTLAVRQMKFWFRAAKIVEDCHDSAIPLSTRLHNLGRLLADSGKLLNIEQELLLWLAATRWLVRIHSFHLAAICLQQYEGLSLKLSRGDHKDVLRIAADLLASDWYQSALAAK